MDRDMNQVAPSFFSLKKFLSHVFYGKDLSKTRYKLIHKTLHFWRDAPENDLPKPVKLRVSFNELITEPINLVNKIYQFIGIKMGSEYENNLIGEAQKIKSYKSEHKYSSTVIDID
tara:strand:- start:508 stop:855 length:348 start_codon:yes stop_codon:yes gene_type:complete